VERLHSDLHAAAAGKFVSPTTTQGSAPALDAARIAALQQDTAVVSALLADIFVEDEEPASAPEPAAAPENSAEAGANTVMGLDVAHSALVKTMLTRSAWTRTELQGHAVALDLMLDGALEHINEASFDTFDMPFVEGEDPFEINPDILESLAS
jgi:hypothetical protein